MFFFGDEQDLADLYISRAVDSGGPGLPLGPVDELNLDELKLCATYLRMAYKMARNEGAADGVIEKIVSDYDAVFEIRARNDGQFYKRVVLGRMNWLGGHNQANVTKYKKLSGMREKKRKTKMRRIR